MVKYTASVLRMCMLGLVFLAGGIAQAQIQSINPTVIGSAGGYATAPTMSLSYSVGEPVVTTVSTPLLTLTQGFEQPASTTVLGLSASLTETDLSCNGANDGKAIANIHTGTGPYTYSWNCVPTQNTQTATGLKPGVYTVTITDVNSFTYVDSIKVNDNTSICGIHVYSGITPNGDGKNDAWVIDYIDMFKPNSVNIFNRWGDKIWHGDNYDNSSVVWRGTSQAGDALPDGTYYYIISIGTSEQKGWVEVTH